MVWNYSCCKSSKVADSHAIDYKLVDAIYIYGLEFDENTKTIN